MPGSPTHKKKGFALRSTQNEHCVANLSDFNPLQVVGVRGDVRVKQVPRYVPILGEYEQHAAARLRTTS